MSDLVTLSPAEADLMRHALGLDVGKRPFHNHFCANPGFDDDKAWTGLVACGMAELFSKPTAWLPYNVYRVSEAGRLALGLDR